MNMNIQQETIYVRTDEKSIENAQEIYENEFFERMTLQRLFLPQLRSQLEFAWIVYRQISGTPAAGLQSLQQELQARVETYRVWRLQSIETESPELTQLEQKIRSEYLNRVLSRILQRGVNML